MTTTNRVHITEVALRDAHQSLFATRMRVDDMLAIASKLDKVGYWSLECWGGATFDACIRFLNEDPWERIRKLKKALPNTRLQMLLRGQNLLGYRHYADDVVDLFVKHACENGVDVFRVFDALNDIRNLSQAIQAIKKNNRIAQGTISYTVSPFHTIERFIELGKELENLGCDSICIKDMAGLLTPIAACDLVTGLKNTISIPISVHSHATTGMAATTLYNAIHSGCAHIDTAISSLSLGTSHAPTESMVAMLENTIYDTMLDLNLLTDIAEYFKHIRKQYSEFESSFSAADARILSCQIPGGMLSNLENQLKEQNAIDKLTDVMKEIPIVRKDLGYPPLVTPTSQIVGTQAVLNVLQGRYQTITAETNALIGGHYGKTPAPIDSSLQKQALGDAHAITCRPADLLKSELPSLRKHADPAHRSDEDILTAALFPKVAPIFFKSRSQKQSDTQPSGATSKKLKSQTNKCNTGIYTVTIDNIAYEVIVEEHPDKSATIQTIAPSKQCIATATNNTIIEAPLSGRVLQIHQQMGAQLSESDIILTIEAMKMETEIKASLSGKLDQLFVSEGDDCMQGEPLYAIK